MGRFRVRRCRKIRKDMDRYLDGELAPEMIHAFEDHLRTCAQCRHRLEQLREQRRLRIASLMPEGDPPSTTQILEALGHLETQAPPAVILPFPDRDPWWVRARHWTFRPVPAIAFAVCLIALGLSFLLPFKAHRPWTPGIVIEKIESTRSLVIYRTGHMNATVIWIVPAREPSPGEHRVS